MAGGIRTSGSGAGVSEACRLRDRSDACDGHVGVWTDPQGADADVTAAT